MFSIHRLTCLLAFISALVTLGLANAAHAGRDHWHRARQEDLPAVWPTPQEISASGSKVSLDGSVTIVTGSGNASDPVTINSVKAIVSSAGGEATVSEKPSSDGTQIFVGTEAQNPAAADVAASLTGESADGLAAEGYVLASGDHEDLPTIVLNGVDNRGTFYAAQTLRQLVDGSDVPGVSVRDWPLMSIRGSIEGFYGIPWSHEARLDQYIFYGQHKLNTYIYTPKDDPLLRAEWRTLYTGEALTQLEELVETANANHVDFTFALSPGNDLCHSSDDDFNATISKFDQLHELGVHSFYIALDDIELVFHCDSDEEQFADPGDDTGYARAQAYYLNRIQKEYIEPKGLKDLQTVPTNYAGSDSNPYKEEFGTQTDEKIRIQWTGEGVFSPEITVDSVKTAGETYVTENLYLWDNFPVNDGKRDHLFLNPLEGRDAELYKYLLGFTSNPLIEPYASMPALANYGDYTWNGPAYDAAESMDAALHELAGSDTDVYDALVAFSDLNQLWPYREPEINSPALYKDMEAFWASQNSSSAALSARLSLLTTLPDVLPNMAMKGFASDVEPWSTLAMQWATACQHLISMLQALDAGDQDKADSEYESAQEWVEKTKAKTVDDRDENGEDLPNSIVPVTAEKAFTEFLANATAVYEG
ncbi:hypothetical protein FQN54_005888 [Arachnomyces sp. PD_36]|nr:hypothetical protein FQN54_005888 [Arachnomyces sp. PD_36]